jgi:hypothetical protein
MGCDVGFYILKRDILTTKFIEVEKEEEFVFFNQVIAKRNIIEGNTYSKTNASVIIQKIKNDTLLLTHDELSHIEDYIYEISVGIEKYGYNPEDQRFVEKMKQFGFELIHFISHGCASLFLLSLGDSESVDYSSWNYDLRDRMNLTKEEFLKELDYIVLLHSKIQLMECDNLDEKNELITIIKNLEKEELLKSVVESHFDTAIENERLVNESSSILFNALKLIKKVETVEDGVIILYS